jgi:predicted HicB family RNase H-like nuclease
MNAITHKGYLAKTEYSDEDELFIGKHAGIAEKRV